MQKAKRPTRPPKPGGKPNPPGILQNRKGITNHTEEDFNKLYELENELKKRNLLIPAYYSED